MKRFFYLEDINTVETVETITKKELLSIAEGLKSFTFSEHDDVISGYTKDGKFFYYDCTNFWTFKKSDIVNAISVVYSSEAGYYVYGHYTVNMYGVVNPTEDNDTLIWTGGNIKEVDNADYTEAEEPAADQEPETIKPFDELTEEELDAIIAEEVEKEYFDEPAADQAEEPTADEIGTALMSELNESLDYFKRVIYDYLDGTRYESDINGDFWGCHECWFLLFHMNARLKTGGKTPFYALENEFCTLSECFEEIRCKYKYGDERTIENILEEYNLIKA